MYHCRAALQGSTWEFCHPPVTVTRTERALEPEPVSVPTGNVMPNLIRLQKTVLPIEMPTRADCFTTGIH